MAKGSSIEWTETTWNPVTGCTKVSPGCRHCYAERMATRLLAMGQASYSRGFEVATHGHMLALPLQWKKPQTIFVNSMSDLFHEAVPEEFIQQVFAIMGQASWHTFQVLTKRSDRLAEMDGRFSWPSNVWAGVSVETPEYLYRIDHLRRVPAMVRFVSFEPLLANLGDIDFSDVHWAIVGGESGAGARPIQEPWVADIRDQCVAAGVPFFFKQWGGVNKKKAGRILQGQLWDLRPQPISGLSSQMGSPGRA